MAPWDQRDYSAFDLRARLMREWGEVPGVRAMAFMPSGLGERGPSTPVRFVLQGPDYTTLARWRDQVVTEAQKSGLFGVLTSYLLDRR